LAPVFPWSTVILGRSADGSAATLSFDTTAGGAGGGIFIDNVSVAAQ